MKRMSSKLWVRLVRQAARRRHQQRRKPSSAPPPVINPKVLAAINYGVGLTRIRPTKTSPVHLKLVAPESLHFGIDHEGVAEFANGIRVLFSGGIPPYLDFTTIKTAGPAAALYIAAEIDRWRMFRSPWQRPRVFDYDDWNPTIRRYFRDLGLFALLGVVNLPPDGPIASERRVLQMRQRNVIDAESVAGLRDELQQLCSVPNRLGFFDALSEAMNNVIHHAYQGPDPHGWPTLPNRWWMTAEFDPGNSTLRIAFLDQGIGIPNRLPLSGLEALGNIFTHFGLKNDDAGRIEAALRYGKSSTGQQGRGKGFHDMQMFVDGNDQNWMRVLSGQGECMYRSGVVRSEQHQKAVVGTIVEWSLVVPTTG